MSTTICKNKEIKKATEFDIGSQFCPDCKTHRFFFRHKEKVDAGWTCQLCNQMVNSVNSVRG